MQLHDLQFATLVLLVSTRSVWAAPPVALSFFDTLQQPHSGDGNLTSSLNIALPPNSTTSPPPVSLGRLPHDPFYYQVPSSSVFLKFYRYGKSIDSEATIGTLAIASTDAIEHISSPDRGPDSKTGTQFKSYSSQNVVLGIWPERQLTWGTWGEALTGLSNFVFRYQFVELTFDVTELGVYLGTASLLIA